jgi:hypothetical protein
MATPAAPSRIRPAAEAIAGHEFDFCKAVDVAIGNWMRKQRSVRVYLPEWATKAYCESQPIPEGYRWDYHAGGRDGDGERFPPSIEISW